MNSRNSFRENGELRLLKSLNGVSRALGRDNTRERRHLGVGSSGIGLLAARKTLVDAVRANRGDTRARLQLAELHLVAGERAEAAEQLTTVLRTKPDALPAATRLAEVLSLGVLPPASRLDHQGLVNALAFDTIDRDLVAAAALHHLASTGPLSRLLTRDAGGGEHIAKPWTQQTPEALKEPLLLHVLKRGVVVRRDLERFFTRVRRSLLLETPRGRFATDFHLVALATALAEQGWLNEHVWMETPEETGIVEALEKRLGENAADSSIDGLDILLASLYRTPLDLLKITGKTGATDSRWKKFDDAFRAAAARDLISRDLGYSVRTIGAVDRKLSVDVAQQYEANPYPRWTAVPIYPEGKYLDHVRTYFRPDQLSFADEPFDVLIAGCGTGRQAVSAALDYGPDARVLGIDISHASLGYAAMMSRQLGVVNLDLARADLIDIADRDPSFRHRFQIIECTGVLHHLEQPFEAWRGLIDCLAPNGIMLIGLYSATARRNLASLKARPGYPGPSATPAALRAWRAELLDLPQSTKGAELLRSRDLYTASGFRDYFLHVSEQPATLTQIAAFLDANGLSFRGFVDVPFAALKAARPGEIAPGSLARWAEWEAANPDAFAGMYQFWCARK